MKVWIIFKIFDTRLADKVCLPDNFSRRSYSDVILRNAYTSSSLLLISRVLCSRHLRLRLHSRRCRGILGHASDSPWTLIWIVRTLQHAWDTCPAFAADLRIYTPDFMDSGSDLGKTSWLYVSSTSVRQLTYIPGMHFVASHQSKGAGEISGYSSKRTRWDNFEIPLKLRYS